MNFEDWLESCGFSDRELASYELLPSEVESKVCNLAIGCPEADYFASDSGSKYRMGQGGMLEDFIRRGRRPVGGHVDDFKRQLKYLHYEQRVANYYSSLLELMRRNSIKLGGELKYIDGTNMIKFVDFIEWADSMEIKLSGVFPRADKPVIDISLSESKKTEVQSQVEKGRFEHQCTCLVGVLTDLGCDPMNADEISKVKRDAFDKCKSDSPKLFTITRTSFDSFWIRAKSKGRIGKR